MSEKVEQEEGDAKVRRRKGDQLDWVRFWWKEWLSSPDVRRLSRDQRGGLMDVFASTYGSKTPGVMDEDDVRAWAGYAPEEWKKVRDVFARCFSLTRRRGKWILERVREDHAASVEIYMRLQQRAMKGVAGRRRGKDLATTGATSGSPQVELPVGPPVQPGVEPRVNKTLEVDVRLGDSRLTADKPEADSDSRATRAQTSRSRAGSAGPAGSSRSSRLEPIVARALEGRPAAKRGSA